MEKVMDDGDEGGGGPPYMCTMQSGGDFRIMRMASGQDQKWGQIMIWPLFHIRELGPYLQRFMDFLTMEWEQDQLAYKTETKGHRVAKC